MVNSIKKGKTFERTVAAWLSKTTNTPWQRVLSSGGYATIHDIVSFRGDIFSENRLYKDLVIEAKDHNKPVNLQDFNNKKSDLNQFIDQTTAEAKGRFWLLFIHWNRSPIFMVAPTTDVIEYAVNDSLKVIFSACLPVCRTKDYLFMELIE